MANTNEGSQKISKVTAEVLNATEEPGLAFRFARVARHLVPELDVLYFGNRPGPPEPTSALVNHGRDFDVAKATLVSLNKAMDIHCFHRVDPGGLRGVDFSVILGNNSRNAISKFTFLDTLLGN